MVSNFFYDALNDIFKCAGNRPFITDLHSQKTYSYKELETHALVMCRFLTDHGIGPGDRVAYLTSNNYFFYPLFIGCIRLGACLVPLNKDDHEEELRSHIEDANVKMVFHDDGSNVRNSNWQLASMDLFIRSCSYIQPVHTGSNAEALIIYTSGTTGNSKGVVLTQGNFTAMGKTLVSFYGYYPGQKFLCMLPFFHMCAPMLTGVACILGQSHVYLTSPYGFTNARQIFQYVNDYKINVLVLTPSIMASQLKLFPEGVNLNTDSLNFCLVGTALLPEQLWKHFEKTFKTTCYQGYGLTETTAMAVMTPPDGRKRYDTAGIPVNCTVKVDGDTQGEVLIKGDIVMKGYNNRKKLTDNHIKQGWFKTGDIGRFEEDGQLKVVGRIKNIVKRRGILIYPEEIDECLRKVTDLIESYTIGVPDDMVGEKLITACVVEDVDTSRLRRHILKSLSIHKCPDEIIIVKEIPKNMIGKVDKMALAALLLDNTT